MPRKRSKQTSPKYGSFIVSSLYNFIGLMYLSGANLENAVSFRDAIIMLFESDEIKESVTKILERIKPVSILQWRRFVHNIITTIIPILSEAHVKEGYSDPFKDIPKRQYKNAFLDWIDYDWRFQDFVLEIRTMVLYSLELIVSGRKEVVESLVYDAFTEFIEEPEKAVAMIRFTSILGGGDELIRAIDNTVEILHSGLLSSSEFSAAVELIEKRGKQDGSSTDLKFGDALNLLTPIIMGRIREKGYFFPRLELSAFSIPSDLSLERMFVMERVFVELLNRATETPFKLIADAAEGKLINSLVVSIENDVKDEIRIQKADKRGFKETGILDEDDIDESNIQSSPLKPVLLLDSLVEKENMQEILNILSEEEREIVNLKIVESLTQEEIAAMLNQSQPWVSNKWKTIKKKNQQFLDENQN